MSGSMFKLSSSLRAGLGLLIIVLTGFGAVMAANISVGNKIPTQEFGQGTYQIKACDSWITMDLLTASTGTLGAPEGLSALTGISIANLDTKTCANTYFTINILDSQGLTLPIYRTDLEPALCADYVCEQGISSQENLVLRIDGAGRVTLRPDDAFHSVDFEQSSGLYNVRFVQPALLANDVGRLNIQSSEKEG
jgi:hypothetical protein